MMAVAHQQYTTLARRACCIETPDRLAIASSDLEALGHGKPAVGQHGIGLDRAERDPWRPRQHRPTRCDLRGIAPGNCVFELLPVPDPAGQLCRALTLWQMSRRLWR